MPPVNGGWVPDFRPLAKLLKEMAERNQGFWGDGVSEFTFKAQPSEVQQLLSAALRKLELEPKPKTILEKIWSKLDKFSFKGAHYVNELWVRSLLCAFVEAVEYIDKTKDNIGIGKGSRDKLHRIYELLGGWSDREIPK